MLKKIIFISFCSISLFAISKYDAYVPTEPTGNEVEIYPNYSKQIQDNLENNQKYNHSEPKEIIINNDNSIEDNNPIITKEDLINEDFHKKNKELYGNNNTNFKDVNSLNIVSDEQGDKDDSKTSFDMEETTILKYEDEDHINDTNIQENRSESLNQTETDIINKENSKF